MRDNTKGSAGEHAGRSAFSAFESCGHQLADACGIVTLEYFRSQIVVTDKNGSSGKPGFDPVTAADRDGEQAIRAIIGQRFPDHAIVGEEHGKSNTGSRYRWIIDPIDGTRAFVMGMPTWGTLIGLADGDQPLFGMMDQPFTRERYWSTADRALYRGPDGERQLKTRRCARFGDAILAATSPSIFRTEREWTRFLAVSQRCKMTRYGGDCYLYCLLAMGLVDLVIEANMETYDIAALIPIIERAGGVVTTWDGGPALDGGAIIAAGDPALHARAVELLSAV